MVWQRPLFGRSCSICCLLIVLFFLSADKVLLTVVEFGHNMVFQFPFCVPILAFFPHFSWNRTRLQTFSLRSDKVYFCISWVCAPLLSLFLWDRTSPTQKSKIRQLRSVQNFVLSQILVRGDVQSHRKRENTKGHTLLPWKSQLKTRRNSGLTPVARNGSSWRLRLPCAPVSLPLSPIFLTDTETVTL